MDEPKYLIVTELTQKEFGRIFSKISVDPETGCWNWTGALDIHGYGVLNYHGKTTKVHRLIYAKTVEPIPSGNHPSKELDHLCDNPKCCNPKHLKLCTHKENVLRGHGPTAINARKVYCKNGHILPASSNRNDGTRYCKVCWKAYNASETAKERKRQWAKKNYCANRRELNKERSDYRRKAKLKSKQS